MREIVKSRSSTPQCEYVKPGLTEAIQLLHKWNLLELQNTFKEHDITLRSLIYLTDKEISELIPKIGIRTIFRAMLKEWRQTCNAITNASASISSLCEMESDSYLDQIDLKTECNTSTTDIELQNKATDSQLDCFKQNQDRDFDLIKKNNDQAPVSIDPVNTTKLKTQYHYEGKSFKVLDILNSCAEGRTVLDFYKIHNFLDIKNRKRAVNILIYFVVECKVEKYTVIFHDMTRQLLKIFPTEKYETFFVPHNGSNSARGALYYRYSNYTRQLRKEGLLPYKKHKPTNCNNLKK